MKADCCILEIIGEKNPEHFFVATQDTDLRRKLLQVSNVPNHCCFYMQSWACCYFTYWEEAYGR